MVTLSKYRWNRSRWTILAVALFCTGCAGLLQRPVTHTPPGPEEFGKTYSVPELKEDMRVMMETLEAVHPNLFATISRGSVDSMRRNLEGALTTPKTRAEFYFMVAPVVAGMGDGHTTVSLPWEEFSRFRSQDEGRAFPFNVAFDSARGVTISRNYSRDSLLAVGDRILSVNGYSLDSLFALFLNGFSGERMVFRQQNAAGSLRLLLWLNKVYAPYDLIVARREGGESVARRVEGATLRDVTRADSIIGRRGVELPSYRFERMKDSIGYIDFRSMVDAGRFHSFLEATFADIQTRPVRGLVIDLRKNGGGNSQLGSDLISFISDSAYRMCERKEWKMSVQYKAYMRSMIPWWIRWFPFTWVSSEARRYFGASDGEIVVDTFGLYTPEDNPLRFRGRTCVLIGPGTFSSAMMLANAVADYKLATLIGEETGGIPTAFGEVYYFDLPNTRLTVGVSSAFFVRANGERTDRRGIVPDIEVRSTEAITRPDRDAVLERARQWILENR